MLRTVEATRNTNAAIIGALIGNRVGVGAYKNQTDPELRALTNEAAVIKSNP